MAVLMLCLALVVFSAVAGLARARSRHSELTRETRAWVQFLHEDLSGLIEVR